MRSVCESSQRYKYKGVCWFCLEDDTGVMKIPHTSLLFLMMMMMMMAALLPQAPPPPPSQINEEADLRSVQQDAARHAAAPPRLRVQTPVSLSRISTFHGFFCVVFVCVFVGFFCAVFFVAFLRACLE